VPGGGQKVEELLTDAVKRECVEELGIEASPKLLVHVIEQEYSDCRKIDFIFMCEYIGENDGGATNPDLNQVGAEWLAVDDLMETPLYPKKLRSAIMRLCNRETVEVYLGNEVRYNH